MAKKTRKETQETEIAQKVIAWLAFIVMLIGLINAVMEGDFFCAVCKGGFGEGSYTVTVAGEEQKWCDDCNFHICRSCGRWTANLRYGRCGSCGLTCRGCGKSSGKLSHDGYCTSCERNR